MLHLQHYTMPNNVTTATLCSLPNFSRLAASPMYLHQLPFPLHVFQLFLFLQTLLGIDSKLIDTSWNNETSSVYNIFVWTVLPIWQVYIYIHKTLNVNGLGWWHCTGWLIFISMILQCYWDYKTPSLTCTLQRKKREKITLANAIFQ